VIVPRVEPGRGGRKQREKVMGFKDLESQEDKVKYYVDVARRYIDAFNKRDLDGVLALFADDAVVCDPFGQRELTGKDALKEFYAGAMARATLELTTSPRGSFGNRIASNVIAKIPGAEITVITTTEFDEDGGIREYIAYWGPFDMTKTPA
jgi:steroid Delta-isomerase